MARNANATVPRCWYTLVRNRPTPGTPIAKSASLCSANSFTWRGVMICSASDFSSSGLSGVVSSDTSSPFTRMVAGRPTLSSRSDALRCTMCVMACLKLNAPLGASGMGIHPEEGLSELDRLGVLHQHLPDHARDFGFDLVHDFHRLDDAHHLPRGDPAPHLDVGLGAGLGGGIERSHHRRLDLDQVGRRSGDGAPRSSGRPLGCCGGGRRLRDVRAARVRRVARLRDPDRRPPPEQTPADLDRAELRRVLQDLHQLRDDIEVHGQGIYTSSRSSVRPSDRSTGPSGASSTSSSIRTPPSRATYTPGSIVTTAPAGSGSGFVFASRGASCTSSPRPWPSEWPNASPKPRAAIGSRASASARRPRTPAPTRPRARCCASYTSPYSARCRSVACPPTTTVRVMSAQ